MGGKTSDKLSADNDWMEPGAGSDLHCLFSKYQPQTAFNRTETDQFLTTFHWMRGSRVKSDGVIMAL